MAGNCYRSCVWVEGGLAFNRRSLHACLIAQAGGGMPFYADHDGGPIPVETVLAAREAIRARRKRGEIDPECRGCPHLETRAWPERETPFDIIGIAQYAHCNIACNYCFLQTQDRASYAAGFRPYPLLEELEALFDSGQLAANAVIDWGGGEPTVYREFDAILDASLKRGAFHYLHTNGVRFPALLEGHAQAGRVHVICSIDAGRSETYAAMKGRDCLDAVWASLERYRRAGCQVTLKYIVTEDNAAPTEIDAFLDRAAQAGAGELIIDIDYDQPDPSEAVLAGVTRLRSGARRAGVAARYGFTGENFAAGRDGAARIAAALEGEQLDWIRDRLAAEGYDGDDAAAALDALIDDLNGHLDERETLIRRLDGRLRRRLLHRIGRALAKLRAALARLGARVPFNP